MPTSSYRCRGADHEDLTEKVREEIFRKRRIFELLPSRKAKPWRVAVTCSHGHANVFKGTGWSQ